MDKFSRRMIKVLIVYSTLFISLVVYLSYFEIFQAEQVVNNNYNKRQWVNEEYVLRGIIADRNGKTLASSRKIDNKQIRTYKFDKLYSHIIGYSFKEYGKAGLESSYNKELLNNNENPIREITEKITGPKEEGNNLILAIDHDLQSYTQKRLKGKKGAIVLMNPKNGEIYAMVSKPDFDPSTMKDKWAEITEDKNSPLLNRATMGLYTPGSIFKIITATSALENEYIEKTFQCEGSININGYVLKDYKGTAHGKVDLKKALIVSCNVAFGQIGLDLGEDKLKNTAEKYMLNKIIPFELLTKNSVFPHKRNMSRPELAATAIGQGKILVTPLNMAMVASAIANDGKMMKPFLVKEVINPKGRTIHTNLPQTLSTVSSKNIAEAIKEMMIDVVKLGTGKNARIKNVKVAGKTGTAENDTEKEHAWFIGFAPADDPKVAIAVVLENEGSTGGKSAAPIARDIMAAALNILK
ncbi:peptidoglycan D,D-transpeptidase FtsI family protein [Marinisporobacter balticus]|uniref:Peptidoglycan glycosyltransferase n=1 Tax=Marinisporobacter balticus TaxID=2018667 RepID=A0A4R2KZX1_9FIRM|nr:penicillin-binding transpeptidase domain-containing protein [Marinisporobacter balticus]TCO72285.1 peptidoglycan glycosyltransferase [Marinisporobacter balticus]